MADASTEGWIDLKRAGNLQLQGVPEFISRQAVLDMLAALGVEARYLRSFTLGTQSVEIEVCALNTEGRLYAEGKQVAVHRIRIPIVDGKDD